MMTESLKGKTRAEAEALFERFHDLITGQDGENKPGAPELGKLAVFSGVREFPVRIKCATLPWHAEGSARRRRSHGLDRVDRGPKAESGGPDMWAQKETTTTRDVVASEIPAGTKFTIPAGARLRITQSLGGSYTVMVPMGYLARIDGRDADAIGEEPAQKPTARATVEKPVEDLCWDQLRTATIRRSR